MLKVFLIFGCFEICTAFVFNNNPTQSAATGTFTKDVSIAVLAQEMLEMKASIRTCESRIKSLEDGTGNSTSMIEFQKALKMLNDLEQLAKTQANETMTIQEKLQKIYAQFQTFSPSSVLETLRRLQANISFVETSLLNIQSIMASVAENSTFVDTIFVPHQLRLVGGDWNAGRVEFLKDGRWGTICSKGGFDNNAAKVICRQLGRPWQNALAYYNSDFGSRSVSTVLNHVQCTGNEILITECPHLTSSSHLYECMDNSEAGVRCQ